MNEYRKQPRSVSTWGQGVVETAIREQADRRRDVGLVSVFFFVVAVVVGIFIVVHQDRAWQRVADDKAAYQHAVAVALLDQFGLEAADESLLPRADHNSTRTDLTDTRDGSGTTLARCLVSTGVSPEDLTVSCPDVPADGGQWSSQ